MCRVQLASFFYLYSTGWPLLSHGQLVEAALCHFFVIISFSPIFRKTK